MQTAEQFIRPLCTKMLKLLLGRTAPSHTHTHSDDEEKLFLFSYAFTLHYNRVFGQQLSISVSSIYSQSYVRRILIFTHHFTLFFGINLQFAFCIVFSRGPSCLPTKATKNLLILFNFRQSHKFRNYVNKNKLCWFAAAIDGVVWQRKRGPHRIMQHIPEFKFPGCIVTAATSFSLSFHSSHLCLKFNKQLCLFYSRKNDFSGQHSRFVCMAVLKMLSMVVQLFGWRFTGNVPFELVKWSNQRKRPT